ncbi:LAFA_0E09868g1_1 [Lachancea sp. 'fantastica']|nr:LAFA_0E09868g1_1 [Lachancea sp. 'fantastica']
MQNPNPGAEGITDWEMMNSDLLNSETSIELQPESNDGCLIERDRQNPGDDNKEQKASEGTNKDSTPEKEVKNESCVKQNIAEEIKPQQYTSFSSLQKFIIFAVIVYIGFLGPLSGNIYIPALPILQTIFNLSATAINATVSVFMAVFAVGPLFWASFADFGGRKILYMISLALTVIINVLLAAVPVNTGALFFLRIMQAFSSSSVMALGAGTVSDICAPKERGKGIAYFMLGPNMGPIVAPIIAGLILMHGSYWRWLFGFTSIMSGVGLLMVIVFLPETLRCIVGNGDTRWIDPKVRNEKPGVRGLMGAKILLCSDIGILKPVSESPEFQQLYPRPPKPSLSVYWNLITFPPVLICSLTTAILFAAYYAFSVTFSHFLREKYSLSNLQIGACYVCPGIALLLGSVSGGHLSDYFRLLWIKRHPNQTFPGEKRLVLQLWGLLLNICGCVGYGWSIQFHHHLAVVLVFSFFTAFGMTWCSNTSMTYLTECIPKRAAGTVAVGSFFRNLAAGVSSVIIMKLCDEMGVGWCFTGLAFCDVASMAGIVYLITSGFNWQQNQ